MLWRQQKTNTRPAAPLPDLEARTQQIGHDLLEATRKNASKQLWSDRLIAWALKNESFKTQLFRFIDVFPVLKTPEAVHRHLVEYLEQPGVELPTGMSLGLKAGGIFKGTLAGTIASQIESMARTFIAGQQLDEALPILEQQWNGNIAFSIDLLGEAVVSETEAAAYRTRYLDLIQKLPAATAKWPKREILESDNMGAIPRVNVSIKISALSANISPVATDDSIAHLIDALAPLLTLAGKSNVLVNFDMEHHAYKDLTIRLFKECCERFDFPAGLALQAYLQSADADARGLLDWSREKKRTVTIRLIKGAYWDFETIHAEMMNWPSAVWRHKPETDACFERLTHLFLSQVPSNPATPHIKLALGTHNIRSIAFSLACLDHFRLPQNAIEFQSLRGMADDLKSALAQRGCRTREYVPLGDMIPGMAYLVRRLLENTSNESWLRAGNTKTLSDEQLLAPPAAASFPADNARRKTQDFTNEPLRDFSHQQNRTAFAEALNTVTLPRIENNTTVEQMQRAIERALAAFPAWRDRPQSERSAILQKAAASLRSQRDALAALIIKESRKTWPEADADVCEAIDFCEFYAREALPLFTPQPLSRLDGESNHELHIPRGPAAVISPWNFPLAICTGMTVAALVTGNPVLLKPAEQTPAIAAKLCDILWQSGFPKDILHFLPGTGELIGAALVRHPHIATIAFTGSKAVGLDILHAASQTPPNAQFVKRVICEMGGKNAIIVDESADLDEAVLAVRHSAFSYAGQKCSACSRLILLDSIHDHFLDRLVQSTQCLALGNPENPATDIPPVIDEEAAQKIRHYIDLGKQEATLAYPRQIENRKSEIENLVEPHIFTNVPPTARIATDEIFGPLLSVFRAKDFSHALELANNSPCKLTGGLFSRTPSHIETARSHFLVGNLYINRGITGALVQRQPFGGFGLSGIGAKAGGTHYLAQFTDPRVITESTLRRGFAPTAE
ncbi:MAG TPA: proline dehydrogenase family protein [Phycisphaerae bacterium]|nr:proline dehydrogenase family protein [Phycisphaerae bacterium]